MCHFSDSIDYVYVPHHEVEQLRILRTGNMNQFALGLEKVAYGDHPDLLLHVDDRFATSDQVNLIQKVNFHLIPGFFIHCSQSLVSKFPVRVQLL